jgi:hypothetical protein
MLSELNENFLPSVDEVCEKRSTTEDSVAVQVIGVISGALRALGNTNAGVTKLLLELYVAVLASGEVPAVLVAGV